SPPFQQQQTTTHSFQSPPTLTPPPHSQRQSMMGRSVGPPPPLPERYAPSHGKPPLRDNGKGRGRGREFFQGSPPRGRPSQPPYGDLRRMGRDSPPYKRGGFRRGGFGDSTRGGLPPRLRAKGRRGQY